MDIVQIMLLVFTFVVIAILIQSLLLSSERQKMVKVMLWVHNKGPEYIIKPDGLDYYKMDTRFLEDFKKEFIDTKPRLKK